MSTVSELLLAVLLVTCPVTGAAERPNMISLMADDPAASQPERLAELTAILARFDAPRTPGTSLPRPPVRRP